MNEPERHPPRCACETCRRQIELPLASTPRPRAVELFEPNEFDEGTARRRARKG